GIRLIARLVRQAERKILRNSGKYSDRGSGHVLWFGANETGSVFVLYCCMVKVHVFIGSEKPIHIANCPFDVVYTFGKTDVASHRLTDMPFNFRRGGADLVTPSWAYRGQILGEELCRPTRIFAMNDCNWSCGQINVRIECPQRVVVPVRDSSQKDISQC